MFGARVVDLQPDLREATIQPGKQRTKGATETECGIHHEQEYPGPGKSEQELNFRWAKEQRLPPVQRHHPCLCVWAEQGGTMKASGSFLCCGTSCSKAHSFIYPFYWHLLRAAHVSDTVQYGIDKDNHSASVLKVDSLEKRSRHVHNHGDLEVILAVGIREWRSTDGVSHSICKPKGTIVTQFCFEASPHQCIKRCWSSHWTSLNFIFTSTKVILITVFVTGLLWETNGTASTW